MRVINWPPYLAKSVFIQNLLLKTNLARNGVSFKRILKQALNIFQASECSSSRHRFKVHQFPLHDDIPLKDGGFLCDIGYRISTRPRDNKHRLLFYFSLLISTIYFYLRLNTMFYSVLVGT